MTRITISEPVLRWAVERSSHRASLEQKFPKLPEWLSGECQPTLNQLEALAKVTSMPLGYFFLPKPPEERLPIPHFRTLDNGHPHQASRDLLETIQLMERRQAWMREYLIEQGCEPLSFVHSAQLAIDPELLAKEIRQTLGLVNEWAAGYSKWTDALKLLINRIEEVGILVAVSGIVGNNTHRKLEPSEFRGFVLVDEYAPLLFVNGADGKAAQMFTLAHELVHIWFGSSAAFDLRDLQPANNETEQVCNRVAAEFLVPARQLCDFWPSIHNEPDRFQAIARHFKVSEPVAARRLVDLGLITYNEFHEFYQNYKEQERRGSRSQEGGNFYATQNLRIGRRFAEAVIRAAMEGTLLYRDAYQLTGLYGRTFEQYAQLLIHGGSP
jgi:Zn-dependent peptidase ImmA (M78 family)